MESFIREMRETDWERVATIYKQGIDTNIATFQNTIPTYEEWDSAHLKHCRYVITNNQIVIGWVALSSVSSRCVYAGVVELSVYIDNEFKGKGIGTRLLMHISEQAEKHGIWTIQVGIMQENQASLKLHRKCGFREIGYREKIGRDIMGTWRNVILMEKRNLLDRFN